MEDMTKLYQQGLENLMKSTAAVPMHLQGANALGWWQEESSLMAKAQMPWDKKDEEEAEDEDKEHDKDAKAKQDDDADEESDDDEDEGDEEEMEKSLLAKGNIENKARKNQYEESVGRTKSSAANPSQARNYGRDKMNPRGLFWSGSEDTLASSNKLKAHLRRQAESDDRRGDEVAKSLEELSAITAQLEGKGDADTSPLLKSIDALNRLAGA